MHQEEHRTHRSHVPDLAIHYQLQQLKDDFGLESALLVDTKGHLISASDTDHIAFYKVLASEVEKLSQGSTCRLLFAKLNILKRIRPNQISTKSVIVNSKQYYIITIGASSLERDLSSFRTYFALRRISNEGDFNKNVVSRKPKLQLS